MESNGRVVIDGGDEEEEHVNRLMALLHDVVRRHGAGESVRTRSG